jgi:hypothetical protein
MPCKGGDGKGEVADARAVEQRGEQRATEDGTQL